MNDKCPQAIQKFATFLQLEETYFRNVVGYVSVRRFDEWLSSLERVARNGGPESHSAVNRRHAGKKWRDVLKRSVDEGRGEKDVGMRTHPVECNVNLRAVDAAVAAEVAHVERTNGNVSRTVVVSVSECVMWVRMIKCCGMSCVRE
jgi:hypothetical protein